MKIRSGFVSNSSSSSFIAIGVEVKKLTDEQFEAIEDAKLEANYIDGEGYFVVGEEFACWDECDGVNVTSVTKLEESIAKVKKNLKTALPDEDIKKVAIHYGIRAS